MKRRAPARRVVQVAELVPLDAKRRRVRGNGSRAVKLEGVDVHRIRLCWRVSGETSQRSRMFTRAELAAARQAHAELVMAMREVLAVDADGWPLDPVDTDDGPSMTFAKLLKLYVAAHPDWTPGHRGNVESAGGIMAECGGPSEAVQLACTPDR